MLSAESINKTYGSLHVLQNVNVNLEPGKITALIGPSGSGKTTLLKALSLLDPPDTGTVCVDTFKYNFPLGKLGADRPWPYVTVVFQQLFLWPHLTLKENILLPLRVSKKNYDTAYLNELVDLFEMKAFIDRYPNQASLGQRQRVALTRALVLNARYVLLDEITSSLDVEQVNVILSHLRTVRDKGIGILAITHLLHFARHLADQIIFMDAGKIVEAGGVEVIDNPQNERLKKFLSLIESAM